MHKLKSHYSLLGGLVFLVLLGVLLVFTKITVANGSDWVDISNLNLQKLSISQTLPLSNGSLCSPEPSGCAIPTFYGASEGSKVRVANQDAYYDVIGYMDNRSHFIAVPNSDQFITYTTDPVYGYYLYFNGSFSQAFAKTNSSGTTQYKIVRPPDGKLADKSGNRLAADAESMSFSENGQWLTLVEPNITALRVNLQTYEVVPFGLGYNYGIGLSVGASSAVSNDGRFAVVSSRTFNSFLLYDLSTCPAVPSKITVPLNCQSRDLNSYLKQQIEGYMWSSNIRFISDDTLSLTVVTKVNGILKSNQYLVSTEAGQLHQLDYLAIGDSYISGEGAFDYQAGTDTANNNCHLSLRSYPLLIGDILNFNSYHSVACSGATTDDIIDTATSYAGQAISKVSRDRYTQTQIDYTLSQFTPGYLDQLEFVTKYQPKVITLSVGGNDIGFADILHNCVMPDTCYSSYEDRRELVRLINSKFNTLVNTYNTVKDNALPDTKIYVIGYPQIAYPGGKCDTNVHLDSSEVVFSTQLINYFDDVISRAAAKAGVYYVDTQHALDGHRLCQASGGGVAVNGLTLGNDIPQAFGGPFGNESYHPNDLGHQMLEQAIPLATRNFTIEMPSPNLTSTPPAESNLDILSAPKTGRPINTIYYDSNISPDSAYKTTSTNINFNGNAYLVKPSSPVQVVLHSVPTNLGSFISDSAGNLSASVSWTSSIEPGIHTLHLYATDTFGNPIDIYKSIFIGASSSDYNGDGIPNSQQPCSGILPAARQDVDQDDIDDACDSLIGAPPTTPVNAANLPKSIISTASATQPNNSPVINNPEPGPLAFNGTTAVLADKNNHPISSSQPKSSGSTGALMRIMLIVFIFSLIGGGVRWLFWQ